MKRGDFHTTFSRFTRNTNCGYTQENSYDERVSKINDIFDYTDANSLPGEKEDYIPEVKRIARTFLTGYVFGKESPQRQSRTQMLKSIRKMGIGSEDYINKIINVFIDGVNEGTKNKKKSKTKKS